LFFSLIIKKVSFAGLFLCFGFEGMMLEVLGGQGSKSSQLLLYDAQDTHILLRP